MFYYAKSLFADEYPFIIFPQTLHSSLPTVSQSNCSLHLLFFCSQLDLIRTVDSTQFRFYVVLCTNVVDILIININGITWRQSICCSHTRISAGQNYCINMSHTYTKSTRYAY